MMVCASKRGLSPVTVSTARFPVRDGSLGFMDDILTGLAASASRLFFNLAGKT
jgi:hypothetical protein